MELWWRTPSRASCPPSFFPQADNEIRQGRTVSRHGPQTYPTIRLAWQILQLILSAFPPQRGPVTATWLPGLKSSAPPTPSAPESACWFPLESSTSPSILEFAQFSQCARTATGPSPEHGSSIGFSRSRASLLVQPLPGSIASLKVYPLGRLSRSAYCCRFLAMCWLDAPCGLQA